MSDKQSRDISEKYSPKWFYEIAQTPEYLEFDKKAKQLQADFVNQFGAEQLKSLTGKDLLTSVYHIVIILSTIPNRLIFFGFQ